MSAGMILVVILVALCLAGLLNADATLRKSNAKGDSWRNGIAKTVASVTDTFQINFFRNAIDDAIGKNQSSGIDVEELLRQQARQKVQPQRLKQTKSQNLLLLLLRNR